MAFLIVSLQSLNISGLNPILMDTFAYAKPTPSYSHAIAIKVDLAMSSISASYFSMAGGRGLLQPLSR